jgi:hypothetical protein
VQNLRAVLVGNVIERAFKGCTSCGECAGGNVVLEEFLVNNIYDGGDEGFDVFGVADEGVNVTSMAWMLVDESVEVLFSCDRYVRLEKSRNE